MPLSNAQTTTFFTHASQMAIPAATVVALNNEGINTVDDLEQILPEDIERISKIFRSQDPVVVFGVTSQKRLTNACHMVRYYNAVDRPLTAQNMKWNPTGRNFELQWKALNQVKDEDDPDVPKISKSLPIMKWKDAFVDMLGRVVGIRDISLLYLIRQDIIVPAPAPPLQPVAGVAQVSILTPRMLNRSVTSLFFELHTIMSFTRKTTRSCATFWLKLPYLLNMDLL